MPSRPPTFRGRRLCAAFGAILLLVSACRSPAEHRAQADREVYALIEERRDRLFGDELAFSIEPPADSLRARLLAGGVQSALMVLFAAMALEHLGVGRQIIIVSFTIVFGGVVFALSLAFGLAGRDLARAFLERLVRRPGEDDKPDEMHHL